MRVTKQVIKDKILNQFGWLSYDKKIKWEITYNAHLRYYTIHCTRDDLVDFSFDIMLGKDDIVSLSWLKGSISGVMLYDIIHIANSLTKYSLAKDLEERGITDGRR